MVEEKKLRQQKGKEFEKYIISLFQLKENRHFMSLMEWQGDRYEDGIYAEANRNPDIVMKLDHEGEHFFAVECKYRSYLWEDKFKLCSEEKMEIYRNFSKERNIPVFFALGLGGQPSKPEHIYIIPLEAVTFTEIHKFFLNQCEREIEKPFFYNAKIKKLM